MVQDHLHSLKQVQVLCFCQGLTLMMVEQQYLPVYSKLALLQPDLLALSQMEHLVQERSLFNQDLQ